MADLATSARRVSGLADFAADTTSIGGVTLADAGPASRFVLRGSEAAAAASEPFGVAIPTTSLRAGEGSGRAALWLGPDEWLLLGAAHETAAIQSALEQAMAGVPHSLVDVSHRQMGIAVEGPGAALALNAAVPLDLSAEAFPAGMCARTIFEKAEIVLWRTGPERFHLEVWRSFAPYVWEILDAVRKENAAAA